MIDPIPKKIGFPIWKYKIFFVTSTYGWFEQVGWGKRERVADGGERKETYIYI